MISLDVARRLAQALRPSTPDVAETSGGVVTRLDNDGTVWVQLHGAEDDTPCTSRTAAVHVGDAVTVTIDGGSARVNGNVTRPATDDERAEEAHELAAQATEEVSEVREQTRVNIMATAIAQSIAEQAQAVADAIGQHFFADTNGVHVTEAEGDPTTEHNILINSLGILLRHAVNPLVSITQSAIAFYDGLGSAAANVVASFGADGARVGKVASYNLMLTAQRIALMLGEDKLVDLNTNGITTTLKFAGSTQAAGTNYTDAELEAIESFLNDGTTTVVDGKVYHDGDDTGYTVRSIGGNYYEVLDAQGDSFSSANYDVMLYTPNSTPKFSLDSAFSPSTEIPGAPVVMEIGGVALTFQDKALKMGTPLPVASGGTGSTGFGTIKTTDISTEVSVPHGSAWHTLGSVTLTEGDWIVSYNAYFASNATGRRGMLIHTAADTAGASSLRQGGVEVMAVDGGVTMLNGCRVLHLTASSTTYYLNVMQSSGANLNVTGYIRAFRLK